MTLSALQVVADPGLLRRWLVPVPREVVVVSAEVVPRGLGSGCVGPWTRTVQAALGAGAGLLLAPVHVRNEVPEAARALPASLRDQAYELRVDPSNAEAPVLIVAGAEAGARHAARTLAQLLELFTGQLPGLRVVDWPAIATRGVMLDISRDRVPTMEHLRHVVDTLARLKVNHLQLYTEHTFAYRGHEEVWKDSSPVTPDELRTLDGWCRDEGIELAANQNCLGHLHRWLRVPRYAPLSEIPPEVESWTFESDDGRAFTKHGPHSLCPTDPGSIELVADLLGQMLPCVSGPLVNIGCDEAFDVGQGRSREAVASRGRAAVYLEFLAKVERVAARCGKQSMFWADIALRHPETLGELPESIIPLVWGYEADSAGPFERASELLQARAARGSPEPWFCPGTSAWLSMTGRTSNRTGNLQAAVRAASKAAGRGVLVCDWGDRGHRQMWPISAHGLAHGADAAWTGDAGTFSPQAAARFALGDASGALGPWLQTLGDLDAGLSGGLRNTNAIFTEFHRPLRHAGPEPDASEAFGQWGAVRRGVEALRQAIEAPGSMSIDALVREELDLTLRFVEHAADKTLICRSVVLEQGAGAVPRGAARIRLAADAAAIAQQHEELWPRRSRAGGLRESVAHYERVIEDYEHA